MVSRMSRQPSSSNRPQRGELFGLRFPEVSQGTESPLRRALRDRSWPAATVEHLVACVGGIEALEALTTEPHLDADFDWAAVGDAHRDAVVAILEAIELALAGELNLLGSSFGLPPLIDNEYRTIACRLLARVSRIQPSALSKSSPARVGAALFWLAIRASDGFERRTRLNAGHLWDIFGVSAGAQLGRVLFAAADIEQRDDLLEDPGRSRSIQLGGSTTPALR